MGWKSQRLGQLWLTLKSHTQGRAVKCVDTICFEPNKIYSVALSPLEYFNLKGERQPGVGALTVTHNAQDSSD